MMVAVPICRIMRTVQPTLPVDPAAVVEAVRRQYVARLRLSGVDHELADVIAGDLVAGLHQPRKEARTS